MMRFLWIFFVLGVLVLLAALLYGSYWFLSTADFTAPLAVPASGAKRVLISMGGFRLVQSEDGQPGWRLAARTAELFESKDAQLRDVEIVFEHPDGRTAALIGENATLDTRTGDATVRRGGREVRIVTSDGYLMTSDTLFWKSGDRVIRTRSPFKVLGKEIYIEGVGMSADVGMRKVIVDSNVKAVLQE
jgi:LPS export ABC transporter protein LptC